MCGWLVNVSSEPAILWCQRQLQLDGLLVLRDFDAKQITKHRSEELRKELRRLIYLKWRTIASCGVGDEVEEAERKMEGLQGGAETRRVRTQGGRR